MLRVTTTAVARFATLNAQFLVNKNRNAVRFESQNLNWDYEVLEYHSRAFAKGLRSLAYKAGDNLLILTPPAQQSEAYVAKVGAAYIDANLIQSKATNASELAAELSSNKIVGLIFEPTLPLGSDLAIDALYKLIPEAKSSIQGTPLQTKNFGNLRFLFQTNFYTYPGVFKYRSIFNYANEQASPLQGSSSHSAITLPSSTLPLVITQPASNFAFRAGILNSLLNGRFVVCAESHQLTKLSQIYGQYDLIATEEAEIGDNVNVFVEGNSNVLASKAKRTVLNA